MRIKIVVAVAESGAWTCTPFGPDSTDWNALKHSLHAWKAGEDRTYYLVEAHIDGFRRDMFGALADKVTPLE